jgi:hypothetical protein
MIVNSSSLRSRHTALTDSTRDSSALSALPPLQQSNGHDAADEDHASHQATAARAAESLFHLGEPEGPDEAPSGAHDVDKDADAGAMLDHAVDGVGDEHGGDDLLADSGDGDADLRTRISEELEGGCIWECLTIGVTFHTPSAACWRRTLKMIRPTMTRTNPM